MFMLHTAMFDLFFYWQGTNLTRNALRIYIYILISQWYTIIVIFAVSGWWKTDDARTQTPNCLTHTKLLYVCSRMI